MKENAARKPNIEAAAARAVPVCLPRMAVELFSGECRHQQVTWDERGKNFKNSRVLFDDSRLKANRVS